MRVSEAHRLEPAIFAKSPNFDARPIGIDVTIVVIHCISLPKGQFGTGLPTQLFLNAIDFEQYPKLEELREYRVSAHLLIERTGAVTQFVPFNERAWHAGESSWQGRKDCNDFSIGIELEGTDDAQFEDPQYEVLVETLVALLQRYSTLSVGNIVGHSEIAGGRKTDPGSGFDWQRLLKAVIAQLNDPNPA
ncbi:MAG: 1,6-anhydro-N-acetylmuramyl-L-alanine amidase AmpD [Gammaproteobacteria bacterium]|nr:1,6-anhydro-N-acetylmuramyl-L-alanine amidase AmpD [Gammaproteobacteria bacterium]